MEQNYFLGLDMGTGSLGWAVTNDKYEVLRRHGKALWGVRLFWKVLIRLKREEGLGQHEEDWTDEIGDYRFCRNCLQRRLQRWIRILFTNERK